MKCPGAYTHGVVVMLPSCPGTSGRTSCSSQELNQTLGRAGDEMRRWRRMQALISCSCVAVLLTHMAEGSRAGRLGAWGHHGTDPQTSFG